MEDFDLAQLAQYLHITPDKVEKMALRGTIPGRKVSGQWRFNEADIHHWLEDRIGATESEDLGQMQKVVDRVTGRQTDQQPIHQLCTVDTIEIPLSARTRGSVIRNMCEVATRSGLMWDAPAMAEAVKARENMHPTALDCGVALLHPRRPQTSILSDTVVALGVTHSPIPFSDTGHSTDIFFLICSYDDSVHLRTLSTLSRLIASDNLLTQLRAAGSAAEAWECMHAAEEALETV
ncbi:PTS sugar transporter subunit IIA [Stieleria varia]|uniref:PTS system fructose-specific EIIABC component n=1 Tax=Stieleria varia TaxID=2528005 RepID=A0A5C6ARQ2_9BACT|nr:PTS sugar transporter subunit IIA [Stieleria varia]TWU02655.1 PTS system fructose-specific EIIABC component [Stieleria varia]